MVAHFKPSFLVCQSFTRLYACADLNLAFFCVNHYFMHIHWLCIWTGNDSIIIELRAVCDTRTPTNLGYGLQTYRQGCSTFFITPAPCTLIFKYLLLGTVQTIVILPRVQHFSALVVICRKDPMKHCAPMMVNVTTSLPPFFDWVKLANYEGQPKIRERSYDRWGLSVRAIYYTPCFIKCACA